MYELKKKCLKQKKPTKNRILWFNQYAGRICFGGVGNVLNVLVRMPHNYEYVNQESLRRLMLTSSNVCVTQTDAERVLKSANCVFLISITIDRRRVILADSYQDYLG